MGGRGLTAEQPCWPWPMSVGSEMKCLAKRCAAKLLEFQPCFWLYLVALNWFCQRQQQQQQHTVAVATAVAAAAPEQIKKVALKQH